MKHPNSHCSIGPMSKKASAPGKHYSPAKTDFSDLPGRIVNSAMPNAEPGEITKSMAGVQRPGSDHSAIKSRGTGC